MWNLTYEFLQMQGPMWKKASEKNAMHKFELWSIAFLNVVKFIDNLILTATKGYSIWLVFGICSFNIGLRNCKYQKQELCSSSYVLGILFMSLGSIVAYAALVMFLFRLEIVSPWYLLSPSRELYTIVGCRRKGGLVQSTTNEMEKFNFFPQASFVAAFSTLLSDEK